MKDFILLFLCDIAVLLSYWLDQHNVWSFALLFHLRHGYNGLLKVALLHWFYMAGMGEMIFHSGWHEFYIFACTSSMRVLVCRT